MFDQQYGVKQKTNSYKIHPYEKPLPEAPFSAFYNPEFKTYSLKTLGETKKEKDEYKNLMPENPFVEVDKVKNPALIPPTFPTEPPSASTPEQSSTEPPSTPPPQVSKISTPPPTSRPPILSIPNTPNNQIPPPEIVQQQNNLNHDINSNLTEIKNEIKNKGVGAGNVNIMGGSSSQQNTLIIGNMNIEQHRDRIRKR